MSTPGVKRISKTTQLACIACGRLISVRSETTEHPGSPEMYSVQSHNQEVWTGVVRSDDDEGADVTLIVACSDACLDRLLSE